MAIDKEEPEQMKSIAEKAKEMKKSRQWVYFLVKTGRIKAKKVGQTYVILEAKK